MNITIVTAFFDINRENNGDGRKMSDYLKWIEQTLKLNCNLYIVTEEKFVHFMESKRPKDYNTFIKEDILENASYYKYLPRMREILSSSEYKSKIAYPQRVECVLPEYNIIQYSKFGWLEQAINENPFNSDFFFWMDAGISRFFYDMNLSKIFPNPSISLPINKFIAQGRPDLLGYEYSDKFIWTANNLIYGGMFGASRDFLLNFIKLIEITFNNRLLNSNCMNNEQIVLGLLYGEDSDLFHIVSNRKCPCDVLHHLY